MIISLFSLTTVEKYMKIWKIATALEVHCDKEPNWNVVYLPPTVRTKLFTEIVECAYSPNFK